jgi:hypothetical protein
MKDDMSRNDFFLDTGIIFGQFEPHDPYFEGSKKHIDKYSYRDHNYYAVRRIALKEIESVSRRKIKEGSRRGAFNKAIGLKAATMKAKVENLFLNNYVKDIDYERTYSSFNELYQNLLAFLEHNKKNEDSKDRDAKILTNVFIWEKEMPELHNPHIITIDKTDLVDNKDGLKNEANKCLNCISRLKFCLISRKHAS